jgi:hypothetical protein
VRAFTQWQEEDARIVQEAADRRVQIVTQAEARVTAVTAQFVRQVATINANAQDRAQDIVNNFKQANNDAFLRNQEQRAEILRSAGQEIRDIEEDHQERLRKLKLDSDERLEELTASRDALGIAKEQRRFSQEEAEENRNTRLEIARRRRDLAERLQELDAQYQAEKAQRLAQFQEALAENEAQRVEQQKQAAAAHAEELKQIREAKTQQLRELQESMNAERIRRREMFIAQVRDLDASLLGERGLKVRYYNLMLQDAERFLEDWRGRMGAMSGPPDHDYTGYAYSGIYRMAANGEPEYVLNGGATRAAENMIGGRLTQDAVLSALARGSGRNQSVSVDYKSRFSGEYTGSMRRAVMRDVQSAVEEGVFKILGSL